MKYIATPYEAEENAAVQMRSLGFSDARVTASGADGGIDVRASGADAQVKWRAGQVGRPELQRLFGARGKRFELQLFFFAASPYSTHAVSYAMKSTWPCIRMIPPVESPRLIRRPNESRPGSALQLWTHRAGVLLPNRDPEVALLPPGNASRPRKGRQISQRSVNAGKTPAAPSPLHIALANQNLLVRTAYGPCSPTWCRPGGVANSSKRKPFKRRWLSPTPAVGCRKQLLRTATA
ncbi:restriction endonuclease [Nocardia farcinica]|nr:restriction endonuclease [Nocardia farcinica]